MIRKVILISLLLVPLCVRGQVEVACAMDLGYPVMLNKYNSKLNYDQISAGIRLGISYKPEDVQFFPTLYFSFGQMRLPLKQYEDNVLGVNINYLNLLLNANFVFVSGYKGNKIYAIGGLGFSRLNPKRLYVAGKNAGAEDANLDSVSNTNRFFPSIELGIEYVYGNSVNSNIYISMGFNLQYIYFFPEGNNYFATVIDANHNSLNLHGALDKYAIIPSVSLCLHYMLNRDLIFWLK